MPSLSDADRPVVLAHVLVRAAPKPSLILRGNSSQAGADVPSAGALLSIVSLRIVAGAVDLSCGAISVFGTVVAWIASVDVISCGLGTPLKSNMNGHKNVPITESIMALI